MIDEYERIPVVSICNACGYERMAEIIKNIRLPAELFSALITECGADHVVDVIEAAQQPKWIHRLVFFADELTESQYDRLVDTMIEIGNPVWMTLLARDGDLTEAQQDRLVGAIADADHPRSVRRCITYVSNLTDKQRERLEQALPLA